MSMRRRTRLSFLAVLMAGAFALPTGFTPAVYAEETAVSQPHQPNKLQTAFESAAQEFGVPLPILMSVAYNESRWEHHDGEPSTSGGYGVMHLTRYAGESEAKGEDESSTSQAYDPALHMLDTAAALLGIDPDFLLLDPAQNIRGGAALLAQYARETTGTLPTDAADWYGAVAKYSGTDTAEIATEFADAVYATIQQGMERTTNSGQHAVLTPAAVTPNTATAYPLHLRNAALSDADCPNGLACRYIPAAYKQYSGSATDYGNYDLANRPEDGNDIRYIVIHDVEGSYESAIKTFLSKSYVSAHYTVNSVNGQVTQMVRPKDVAWHAGNWFVNAHSIGIEHSGFAVEGATWYSEQMYRSSAKLVRYLADRYDVPLDRLHIIGHDDIPGLTPYNQTRMHWDPGAFFDWAHYFSLLGASFNPSDATADSNVVTIDPNFHTNLPYLKYNKRELEPQPASFVYLHTAPSFDAPLISDPALHPDGSPGTHQIYDWGNKAVTGQRFVKADQQGDWTAIYYGGQKAWLHDPNGKNTSPGSGLLVKPKAGLTSIPVYGSAFPEAAAYTAAGIPARLNTALQYRIQAEQAYVATEAVTSDYFYAKLFNAPSTYRVVEGADEYYQIHFNHRFAFVKKTDVEVVSQ